jgi:UDP-N-acetylmuramate dehydrogenase
VTVVADDAALATAAGVLDGRAARDEPLGPLTTYRVGGAAALFVRARTLDDLVAVAEARRASGLPVLVIGKGSNLLVADAGFAGIAVSVAELAGDIEVLDGPEVRAGGGVPLPVLARRTAAAGLTGLEWAVGVPGTVGGAVRMNAGGHGSDIAECLVDVVLFDLDVAAPAPAVVPPDRLGLRFRSSDLGDQQIVLAARLRVAPGDRAVSEATIADIVRWRREHQPGGQNCGSVFVNPVPGEVTAGGLVDGLGLRGHRIGSAWVSEKHANFVQASDGGTAADVRALIEDVRARVADATGFELRSEVRLVGFEDVT